MFLYKHTHAHTHTHWDLQSVLSQARVAVHRESRVQPGGAVQDTRVRADEPDQHQTKIKISQSAIATKNTSTLCRALLLTLFPALPLSATEVVLHFPASTAPLYGLGTGRARPFSTLRSTSRSLGRYSSPPPRCRHLRDGPTNETHAGLLPFPSVI